MQEVLACPTPPADAEPEVLLSAANNHGMDYGPAGLAESLANQRQVELADALHLAGADLVVGSHAHRLQGAGFRNGKFVAYGQGNYIFNAPSAESRKAATLLVRVTGQRVDGYEWQPATIENSVPVTLDGSAADAALAELDQRRTCAGLEPAPPVPTASPAGAPGS